jgi:hypothetical protein
LRSDPGVTVLNVEFPAVDRISSWAANESTAISI